MITANKGEWSELYVFLKLLADGRLFAADEDLNRIANIFYPVLSILRHDAIGNREYSRTSEIRVIESDSQVLIASVPIAEFVKASAMLLTRIQTATGPSFAVPGIESFAASIDVKSLKARSTDKRDITVVVHDLRTGLTPELGFSIKSNLGARSTLLNPGTTTNFVYEVSGPPFTSSEVNAINSIKSSSKVRDRINRIIHAGRQLLFVSISSATFELNLQIIDTLLPEIVGRMLIHYYRGEGSAVSKLTQILTRTNPLNFDLSLGHPLYEYKVKALLTDIALGMTPAKPWRGRYDATGGYIIVKADGDLVCYHIYNRNEFQDYLIQNTILDTPSTSRYGFAHIYAENGKQYFNLNLQIRFI